MMSHPSPEQLHEDLSLVSEQAACRAGGVAGLLLVIVFGRNLTIKTYDLEVQAGCDSCGHPLPNQAQKHQVRD